MFQSRNIVTLEQAAFSLQDDSVQAGTQRWTENLIMSSTTVTIQMVISRIVLELET